MSSPALWSLLHDAFGDGKDLLLGQVVSRVSTDALRSLPLAGLKAIHPEVKLEIWEAFLRLRSQEERRHQDLTRLGIRLLRLGQPDYPQALYELYDPPPFLYQRGQDVTGGLSIAIVGARKATHYGKEVAEKFGKDLSHAGVSVTSGLARGIDGRAHQGALKGPGGTVAVLGCGVDVIYPAEHGDLAQEILGHPRGTILSECPLGSQPLPFRFPRRNRLVAALSRGVVVVEAGQKSGALITARLANDLGRDVFAVPGLINSTVSKGPHLLIQDGAKLTTQIQDILDEYGQQTLFVQEKPGPVHPPLDPDQKKIFACLSPVPLGLEVIVEKAGLPVDRVMTSLSLLEIYGLIEETVGRQYRSRQ